jgi:small subunit ribosomal protein S17
MAETSERKLRKTLIGVVTRDKTDKTRRVEISRLVKHARYGKYVKNRTVCYAHDEKNETKVGDTVEIMESRPISKLKCWRLVRVVKKAPLTADEAAAAKAGNV